MPVKFLLRDLVDADRALLDEWNRAISKFAPTQGIVCARFDPATEQVKGYWYGGISANNNDTDPLTFRSMDAVVAVVRKLHQEGASDFAPAYWVHPEAHYEPTNKY